MKWLRYLMARLRPEPIAFPYPSEVTVVARVGASTEICESEWRTAMEVTRVTAYQNGLIEGELRGRMALSREIEAEFGEGGQELTGSDATRLRQRQLH